MNVCSLLAGRALADHAEGTGCRCCLCAAAQPAAARGARCCLPLRPALCPPACCRTAPCPCQLHLWCRVATAACALCCATCRRCSRPRCRQSAWWQRSCTSSLERATGHAARAVRVCPASLCCWGCSWQGTSVLAGALPLTAGDSCTGIPHFCTSSLLGLQRSWAGRGQQNGLWCHVILMHVACPPHLDPLAHIAGSFCDWILVPEAPEMLIVENAAEDARFQDNPFVKGDPRIRFYAGAPLVATRDGHRYGTLW